jgi:hypothetical protein
MKKVMTLILCTMLALTGFSQWYISPSVSFYNGAGNFDQKGMATVEVGKTFEDVLSVGVAVGKTDFTSNSKVYTEARFTVNAITKGKISILGTLGAGYIFDSETNFLTEYGISGSYAVTKGWGVSLFTGKYNFNGGLTSSTATFVGVGVTLNFSE